MMEVGSGNGVCYCPKQRAGMFTSQTEATAFSREETRRKQRLLNGRCSGQAEGNHIWICTTKKRRHALRVDMKFGGLRKVAGTIVRQARAYFLRKVGQIQFYLYTRHGR